MNVINIHERELETDYEQAAKLIDSLSSEDDLLWPKQCWHRMKFDRPLSVDVQGKCVDMNETKPMMLSTDRLELIGATTEYVRAELEAPERLAALLEAQVERGWPPGEYDRDAQEFFLDRLTEGGIPVVGWYGWYTIRRGNASNPSVLIGAGGYLGPPNEEGVVEIGFSVMPSWQGMGYGTEIAKILVKNAFSDIRIQKVIAHTTPGNHTSCKVLEKCGFHDVRRKEDSGNDLFEILRDVNAEAVHPADGSGRG